MSQCAVSPVDQHKPGSEEVLAVSQHMKGTTTCHTVNISQFRQGWDEIAKVTGIRRDMSTLQFK